MLAHYVTLNPTLSVSRTPNGSSFWAFARIWVAYPLPDLVNSEVIIALATALTTMPLAAFVRDPLHLTWRCPLMNFLMTTPSLWVN